LPEQSSSLRVLMISKACLMGAYQRKLEEIAAHPDIDLTVVVPPFWNGKGNYIPLERVYLQGYRMEVLPLRFNGNFHLHYHPGLRKLIEVVRPHIVHIDEEPYNLSTFHALRLARRYGAKGLFFSWQNLLRRYPPPFSQMERRVLHHADYGIAGNEEAVEVWREKGYTGPLAVIPQFGVDPAMFSPIDQPPDREHFTIGYAGRFVPEKGLDLLIQAVAGLSGKWVLHLLGDGPLREEIQTLAGVYNISGSVRFEEKIPSTEMPNFYHQLDALVLPSRTQPNWKEQFGRVLIEAMACGVPVVGAESGAIPGVIGGAGLTFPEGDSAALQRRLQTLIDDPDLRRSLSAAGRKRVLDQFTQARIASQTVAIYRELAAF
jgi:glycosyltransferase involved in cell wall biosynthesis